MFSRSKQPTSNETSYSVKMFWHLGNLIGTKKNAKNLNKMLEVNACGSYQESIIAGVNLSE